MKASLCLIIAANLLSVQAAWAFAQAKVGNVIENVELRGLDGNQYPLLSNATANVFIFFKPGQEHSRAALSQLAACEKEMASNSVRWVAIVSDRFSKVEVETAVKETGISMPVLIDAGNALYGKLGVALCPVLGIADQDHKLVAYEYFTKVNFAEIVRARLRYLLKEISVQELERALNPSGASPTAEAEKARRRFKLAEKLFQAKSYQKALENVNKSLEEDRTSAAAYVLKGQILVALGDKAAARGAFAEALKRDPSNRSALEGMKAVEK